MHKMTKKRARMLQEHPEIVARIFELNAQGVSTAILHNEINDEFSNAPGFIDITSTIVRKLLHQQPPLGHPSLFELVKPEHRALVQSRFQKNVRPRKSAAATPKTPLLQVVQDILEAKRAYEACLDNAVRQGWDREKVVAVVRNLESLGA